AHSNAVDLVHRVGAHAALRGWIVRIGALWKAEVSAGVDERGLPRSELVPRVAPNRDRAAFVMVGRVAEIAVVFEALEVRQARFEAPLGHAQRGPLVEIVRERAERDARVDRRGAAHDFAAWKIEEDLPWRGPVLKPPIVQAPRVSRAVAEIAR